jgi:predicted nucleic acid-binding protein
MSEQYVIDTSILMQAYIHDTNTSNVHALIGLLAGEKPPELHYLDIGLAESTNVLWKQIRWGNLDLEDAMQTLQDIRDLPLIIHIAEPYTDNALRLAVRYELAVYDSLYLVLAQELNCSLITADKKQGDIAEQVGVTLKSITDFMLVE